MSDFKAKMYQIVCRLGIRPRPRWGSLQRSPRPPSWILGVLLLRGREGTRGERREGRVGEVGKGRKRERGREGRGKGGRGQGRPPKWKLGPPLLFSWRRRWIYKGKCRDLTCNWKLIKSAYSVTRMKQAFDVSLLEQLMTNEKLSVVQ